MKRTGVFFLAVMTMLVGFPLVLALIITKRVWQRFARVLKRTSKPARKKSTGAIPSKAYTVDSHSGKAEASASLMA